MKSPGFIDLDDRGEAVPPDVLDSLILTTEAVSLRRFSWYPPDPRVGTARGTRLSLSETGLWLSSGVPLGNREAADLARLRWVL